MRVLTCLIFVAAAALPVCAVEGSSRRAKDPVPTGDPGTWVITDDYPAAALRANLQGITAFRLTVGADGRVLACRITQSSGSAELDETTCQLIAQRAVFDAATNSKGVATTGTYSYRVRWVIPTDGPGGPAEFQLLSGVRTFAYSLAADGTPSDCSEELDGKAVPTEQTNSPAKLE